MLYKLLANPDDGAGWALLARSYVEMAAVRP